jgi:hypothetical protein
MLFTLTYIFKSGDWKDHTVEDRMNENFEDFKNWVRKMRKEGVHNLDAIADKEFQIRLNEERGLVSNNVKAGSRNKGGYR